TRARRRPAGRSWGRTPSERPGPRPTRRGRSRTTRSRSRPPRPPRLVGAVAGSRQLPYALSPPARTGDSRPRALLSHPVSDEMLYPCGGETPARARVSYPRVIETRESAKEQRLGDG